MTKLEKKLLKRKFWITLLWLMLASVLVWAFTIHWMLGFVWAMLLFPLVIWVLVSLNLYCSKFDYFILCRKLPQEIRKDISNQCENVEKYPHVGELAFTETYVIFTKFGVVLSYDQIVKISLSKGPVGFNSSLNAFAYTVTFQLSSGKEYKCDIYNDASFFKGPNSAFDQAMALYREKRMEVSNLIM